MAVAPLLTALLLLGSRPPQQTNLEKLNLFKKIRNCTVKVYADFPNASYTGSGVGIRRYDDFVLLISNSHVVKDDSGVAPRIAVKPWKKGEAQPMPAYLLFQTKAPEVRYDMAFLVVRDPAHLISVADVVPTDLRGDEKVYACGNPQDEEFLVTEGKVLKYPRDYTSSNPDFGYGLTFHTALIEHGSSGGGLFNDKGELVGINTWMQDGKIGLAFKTDDFERLFKFSHTKVWASRDGWQGTGIAAKKAMICVLAVGRWTCESGQDPVNAGGFSGAGTSAFSEFNFGAALLQVGDQTVPIDRVHKGPNGKLNVWEDARWTTVKNGSGEISLRINDTKLDDNSGSLDVFFLTMDGD